MEACPCVYEPAEDSELALWAAWLLGRLAGGAGVAVDLGCGTGVVALGLVKAGFPRVVAVDSSRYAVECARANLPSEAAVVECDGLSCLEDPDVVVANLPYLPVGPEEDGCGGALSAAWAAGPGGEVAVRLCREAARARVGVGLVYSTLTPVDVASCIEGEGFRVAATRRLRGFFEELVALVALREDQAGAGGG